MRNRIEQGCGLSLDVSVSRRSRLGLVSRKIVNVSISGGRRLGLGHLRLVPKTWLVLLWCQCINSFLMGMQMAPYAVWTSFRRCKIMQHAVVRPTIAQRWKQWTWKITSRPVIAINKTCTLTSRSRLGSYKRLVSKF